MVSLSPSPARSSAHPPRFAAEREPVTGTTAPLEREQFMRNKLLVSTAVLAAAIAVASCEKTPSEEPAGSQSGSATSEGRQSQSAPAQQRGTEEPVQQTQPSDAQQHSTQTANQPAAGGNEQQSKEGQRAQ